MSHVLVPPKVKLSHKLQWDNVQAIKHDLADSNGVTTPGLGNGSGVVISYDDSRANCDNIEVTKPDLADSNAVTTPRLEKESGIAISYDCFPWADVYNSKFTKSPADESNSDTSSTQSDETVWGAGSPLTKVAKPDISGLAYCNWIPKHKIVSGLSYSDDHEFTKSPDDESNSDTSSTQSDETVWDAGSPLSKVEKMAGLVVEEQTVEDGVYHKDIEFLMEFDSISRSEAVRVLKAHNGDLIGALLELGKETPMEDGLYPRDVECLMKFASIPWSEAVRVLKAHSGSLMGAVLELKETPCGTKPNSVAVTEDSCSQSQTPMEDEAGVYPKDIEFLMEFDGLSRSEAVRVLKAHNGDLIGALLELGKETPMEDGLYPKDVECLMKFASIPWSEAVRVLKAHSGSLMGAVLELKETLCETLPGY